MTLILFIRLWGENMPIAIGNNAVDNIAFGGNELDKMYLGSSVLFEKGSALPVLPRRDKLLFDWLKSQWETSYGSASHWIYQFNDNSLDNISSSHSRKMIFTNVDNKILNFENTTSGGFQSIGDISSSYSGTYGWGSPSKNDIQTMAESFPTYCYNNGILVPASGMSMRYSNSDLSTEYDFNTLEPTPLPTYFPDVNLDTIFNTYYTAPTPWFADIVGIIDDNTVGFIRAFWKSTQEASINSAISQLGDIFTYGNLYTSYYHNSIAHHCEYGFKLNRTNGNVISNEVIYTFSSGRHYLDTSMLFRGKMNDRSEDIQIYSNILGYPEIGSGISGKITVV